MVALHINATLSLCRAAVPFMRELGGGYIINVSSLGAFLPARGLAVYGATKAFLNYYSQSLQMELAGSGIEVQALCPGYTRTEFNTIGDLAQLDTSKIPGEYWMDAESVVATSLAALGQDQVLVIPGETNLSLAQKGAQAQRDLL
jgi:short-subunit dehydrogenase